MCVVLSRWDFLIVNFNCFCLNIYFFRRKKDMKFESLFQPRAAQTLTLRSVIAKMTAEDKNPMQRRTSSAQPNRLATKQRRPTGRRRKPYVVI